MGGGFTLLFLFFFSFLLLPFSCLPTEAIPLEELPAVLRFLIHFFFVLLPLLFIFSFSWATYLPVQIHMP